MVETSIGESAVRDNSVEEICEPRELVPNQLVRFVAKQAAATIFYFTVEEPCKITVDSWELQGEASCSNTDIFVTVNEENVGKDNYKWKSVYGVDKIDIYPDDPSFRLGVYRVAYVTFSDGP